MLITTTDVLQGVEISEYVGLIVAQTATANTAKTMFKLDLTKMSMESMQLINEAVEKSAKEVGADAVIGLRVMYQQGGLSGFMCYGTAVKLKK